LPLKELKRHQPHLLTKEVKAKQKQKPEACANAQAPNGNPSQGEEGGKTA